MENQACKEYMHARLTKVTWFQEEVGLNFETVLVFANLVSSDFNLILCLEWWNPIESSLQPTQPGPALSLSPPMCNACRADNRNCQHSIHSTYPLVRRWSQISVNWNLALHFLLQTFELDVEAKLIWNPFNPGTWCCSLCRKIVNCCGTDLYKSLPWGSKSPFINCTSQKKPKTFCRNNWSFTMYFHLNFWKTVKVWQNSDDSLSTLSSVGQRQRSTWWASASDHVETECKVRCHHLPANIANLLHLCFDELWLRNLFRKDWRKNSTKTDDWRLSEKH